MNDAIHPLWLIAASLAFSTVPLVIGVCTAYLKVSVVLGMLKSGIGAQQVPGILLVMSLSLALTGYVMGPVIEETIFAARSIKIPTFSKVPEFGSLDSLKPLVAPWRDFMSKHAGERELAALSALSEKTSDRKEEELVSHGRDDLRVLLPAFMLTELKEAFSMGFVLLLPFLVVDLVVANVLAGMGMFMVSPAMISLPLKLLLFVVSDGWLLLSRSLIVSYGNA